MKPYWSNENATLWQGHVLNALAAMEAQSVHLGVTSPPYWGLRSYNTPDVEWGPVSYAPMPGLAEIEIPGCEPGCEHVWGEAPIVGRKRGNNYANSNLNGIKADGYRERMEERVESAGSSQYCQLCNGWRGSLGLEPTIEMYVGHIVLIWRALWRVLRDDATCWLNLGDAYCSTAPGTTNAPQPKGSFEHASEWANHRPDTPTGLKPKDLCGIPWRCALALQADGWYLRSEIIWAKGVSFCPTYSGSCMPESVRDRPTKGHEQVFLLSKNKRYYYDATAVREKAKYGRVEWSGKTPHQIYAAANQNQRLSYTAAKTAAKSDPTAGRNLRTVWLINPGSFKGAHFATFPPKLVEPMILAGSSARGCCPECGSPWQRATEKTPNNDGYPNGPGGQKARDSRGNGASAKSTLADVARYDTTTTGWSPTCTCGTEHPIPQEELDADPTLLDDFEIEPFEPVPATVLDIFAGSGTTMVEAIRLGRHGVGIELSKEYCDDHIKPRLVEPLFDWAQEQPEVELEPQAEQMELTLC